MGNFDKKEQIDKKVEDLHNKAENSRSQEEILVSQLCDGMETYKQHKKKVFISALTAGLEIGFSYLLIVILVNFLSEKISEESLFYVTAFSYPFGFIIVVLGKSILFTEQTSLLALPVLHKKRTLWELLRLWAIVISGNLIGGIAMTFLIVLIGVNLEITSYESVAIIAQHVSKGSTITVLFSAMMAGWLMALLSWLLSSSEETISKIIIIYLITLIVGFAGFHHSIVGNIEVFAGLIFTNSISFVEYLSFLLAALFGNAIGGVFFVALLRYRSFAENV
jgi:formate/nitrite transporter FocA (FNT family)